MKIVNFTDQEISGAIEGNKKLIDELVKILEKETEERLTNYLIDGICRKIAERIVVFIEVEDIGFCIVALPENKWMFLAANIIDQYDVRVGFPFIRDEKCIGIITHDKEFIKC